ncbi:MAG: aspartyl protease family protein [Bacteroidales bacterium]|nr:aspartyl protease family protein [Bacteroidales bacterium]
MGKLVTILMLVTILGMFDLFSKKNINTNKPDDVVWIKCPSFTSPAVYSPKGDFESLVIPIKRAGNLILIDAIVDTLEGNLIFDTGASGLVLNSTYFRSSELAGNRTTGSITGSVMQVSSKKIKHLQISEMYFENIYADVANLGHIENARQVKILGLFGFSMLTDMEIVVDLKNSVIGLHRLDKEGKRLSEQSTRPEFDLSMSLKLTHDIVFLKGNISDKNLMFCLDTGAETNVLNSHLPNKVLSTVSILRRSTLRGVGTTSAEVFYGIMNDFSINKIPFNGMTTIITNLGAMEMAYGVHIDGMLGCDFLDTGTFYINLKKKELGICLNRS